MPITDKNKWDSWVKANKDSYGAACVTVARRAMEILDEESGNFDTHKLICRADDEMKVGGITGFMAGCVASMISECHSRGEEFRKKWNKDNQLGDEGEKANEGKGVLNMFDWLSNSIEAHAEYWIVGILIVAFACWVARYLKPEEGYQNSTGYHKGKEPQ